MSPHPSPFRSTALHSGEIEVRMNGQVMSTHRPRWTTETTSQVLENAKRIAGVVAPRPHHAPRCRCKPCAAHRHHLWSVLRALYRWPLARIGDVYTYDHSTVHHGVARLSGMTAGARNRQYMRRDPGKRVKNRINKLRLKTMASRKKEWRDAA